MGRANSTITDAIAVWVLVSTSGASCRKAPDPELERGDALFQGAVPLSARIVGHDQDLPRDTARCSNCHPAQALRARQPTSVASASPVETFGPVLSRASLTLPAPRRGGPQSLYDQAAFCTLLAGGIDPAHVMIPQTMPRYRLAAQDCQALWTYVTSL